MRSGPQTSLLSQESCNFCMAGASPTTTIHGQRRSQRGIVVAPLAGAMLARRGYAHQLVPAHCSSLEAKNETHPLSQESCKNAQRLLPLEAKLSAENPFMRNIFLTGL